MLSIVIWAELKSQPCVAKEMTLVSCVNVPARSVIGEQLSKMLDNTLHTVGYNSPISVLTVRLSNASECTNNVRLAR